MSTSTEEAIPVSNAAWKCLEGAYDLQIHVGPDVIARRIDDIDCAKEFLAHGLQGIRPEVPLHPDRRARTGRHEGRSRHQGVRRDHAESQRRRLQSRSRSNSPDARTARSSGCRRSTRKTKRPDGSTAEARSCRSGQRFSANSPPKASRRRRSSVVDASGERRRAGAALPRAHRQAQHDSGDRPPRAAARSSRWSAPRAKMGVKKVLVTHAEFPSQSLTGDEQKELADLGAIIEHCFTTTYTGKAPVGNGLCEHPQDRRVAHVDLHRPRPDHQSAGRRRVRHVRAAPAGRRFLRRTRCARWRSRIRRGSSRNRDGSGLKA